MYHNAVRPEGVSWIHVPYDSLLRASQCEDNTERLGYLVELNAWYLLTRDDSRSS
jgi:hypothetical protein